MSKNEQLISGSTAVAEKPTTPAFAGKHFEAAVEYGARNHMARILQSFDGAHSLPKLEHAKTEIPYEASEKRHRKVADLLMRELPAKVPDIEDGVNEDYIRAVGDNLAWYGIEHSITADHLGVVQKAVRQLELSGKHHSDILQDLKRSEKGYKSIVINDSHIFRTFFDSEVAAQFGLDSPEQINNFLTRSSIIGDSEQISGYERGISLEIAAKRYLSNFARSMKDEGKEEIIVNFGSSQEDAEGGDIIILSDSSLVFIDLKNSLPDGLTQDEIEQGYKLEFDDKKHQYKAIVWSESRLPVARESFRLTDPSLKQALEQVLKLTS